MSDLNQSGLVDDRQLERRYLGDGREGPWLMTNMVATIDGATAIDGRSSSIGDRQDTVVFRALRTVADIVLVAAATARAEEYKKPRLPDHLLAWRAARGMRLIPKVAIVSGSLDFDIEPFEDDPPLIITSETAPADRLARFASLTDVEICGPDRVDLGVAVRRIWELGHGVVLSEGGPSLNGQLAAADLIDEVCLTVAPILVAGDSSRIFRGPAIPTGLDFHIDRVLTGKTSLFTRWLRTRDPA